MAHKTVGEEPRSQLTVTTANLSVPINEPSVSSRASGSHARKVRSASISLATESVIDDSLLGAPKPRPRAVTFDTSMTKSTDSQSTHRPSVSASELESPSAIGRRRSEHYALACGEKCCANRTCFKLFVWVRKHRQALMSYFIMHAFLMFSLVSYSIFSTLEVEDEALCVEFESGILWQVGFFALVTGFVFGVVPLWGFKRRVMKTIPYNKSAYKIEAIIFGICVTAVAILATKSQRELVLAMVAYAFATNLAMLLLINVRSRLLIIVAALAVMQAIIDAGARSRFCVDDVRDIIALGVYRLYMFHSVIRLLRVCWHKLLFPNINPMVQQYHRLTPASTTTAGRVSVILVVLGGILNGINLILTVELDLDRFCLGFDDNSVLWHTSTGFQGTGIMVGLYSLTLRWKELRLTLQRSRLTLALEVSFLCCALIAGVILTEDLRYGVRLAAVGLGYFGLLLLLAIIQDLFTIVFASVAAIIQYTRYVFDTSECLDNQRKILAQQIFSFFVVYSMLKLLQASLRKVRRPGLNCLVWKMQAMARHSVIGGQKALSPSAGRSSLNSQQSLNSRSSRNSLEYSRASIELSDRLSIELRIELDQVASNRPESGDSAADNTGDLASGEDKQ